MALQTFTYTGYCSSGNRATRYGVQLIVTENSISTSGNTSNITCDFYLGGAGALGLTTDYTGSSFSGYSCTGVITVNGTQKVSTSSTPTINNSTKVKLATWTGNVTHGSDGTLTIPIKGTFSGGTSAQASGGSISGNVTLTKIARASTITCASTNIGATATVNITRADSSFTHTLTYSFDSGSITGTIATATTSTTPTFTVPTSLYAKIPSGTSITGTITCTTLSGSTTIGTSTCSITATVPSTAIPTLTVAVADTDTVSKNTIGLYVVGKSKPKFTFTFSSSYSATAGHYELTIGGTTYSTTESTYTMVTALTSTSTSYSIVAYDSRGNKSTAQTGTITAYAYSNPTGTITVDRDSSTTTTVNYTYSASITNVNSNNKNAHSIKVEYKLSTATSWTALVTDTTNYTKTSTTGSVTGLSDSSTYDFRITVADSYNTSPTPVTAQVGSSFVLMDFKADGTAMAIGQTSTTASTLEINLPTRIKGTAASGPLRVRGIVGCTSNGASLEGLYLQYGASNPVYFGNAGGYTISADGSTYSGTSAKATVTAVTNTSGTYYPVLTSGTGGQGMKDSGGLVHIISNGTTSAGGYSLLALGNATAEGTANNQRGFIRFYSGSTSYHDLRGGSNSTALTSTMPDQGGTMLNTGNTGACTAHLNGTNYTMTTKSTEYTIPLTTLVNTSSSLFSLSSNGIKCAVAGNYLVTAQIYYYSGVSGNTCYADIYADSTLVARCQRVPNGNYQHFAVPAKVVALTAGQVIYLKGQCSAASAVVSGYTHGTYLTVQKIS